MPLKSFASSTSSSSTVGNAVLKFSGKLAENDSLPMKDILYKLLEQVGIMRDEKSKKARANYLQGLQDQETAARAERDGQRQRWARRHNQAVESYESDEDSEADDGDDDENEKKSRAKSNDS